MEIEKILNKVDQALNKNDYIEAERILTYWCGETKEREQISLLNELLGLYRKTKQKEKAILRAKETENLLYKLKLENTETGATIFINIATVYSAFNYYKEALAFYKKSETVLEQTKGKGLLASLYNNMGTCYSMLEQYKVAIAYLNLALLDVEKKLDKAITYLNLADIYSVGLKDEIKENECVEKAKRFFFDNSVKEDGYFAFVAEKCAPGFRIHKQQDFADYLENKSKSIYKNQSSK